MSSAWSIRFWTQTPQTSSLSFFPHSTRLTICWKRSDILFADITIIYTDLHFNKLSFYFMIMSTYWWGRTHFMCILNQKSCGLLLVFEFSMRRQHVFLKLLYSTLSCSEIPCSEARFTFIYVLDENDFIMKAVKFSANSCVLIVMMQQNDQILLN